MSVLDQLEVDVCPVAFPGKYQVWVIPGLWSLTGRQRPRWWFSSSCVCAVAPVHSSVELPLWRVYVSVETITHNSMSSDLLALQHRQQLPIASTSLSLLTTVRYYGNVTETEGHRRAVRYRQVPRGRGVFNSIQPLTFPLKQTFLSQSPLMIVRHTPRLRTGPPISTWLAASAHHPPSDGYPLRTQP